MSHVAFTRTINRWWGKRKGFSKRVGPIPYDDDYQNITKMPDIIGMEKHPVCKGCSRILSQERCVCP